jgi:hypothetical protein
VAERLGVAAAPKGRGGRHECTTARNAESTLREDAGESGAERAAAEPACRPSGARQSPIRRNAAKTKS